MKRQTIKTDFLSNDIKCKRSDRRGSTSTDKSKITPSDKFKMINSKARTKSLLEVP